jgi:CxxC motif-containing protein
MKRKVKSKKGCNCVDGKEYGFKNTMLGQTTLILVARFKNLGLRN